MDNLNRIGILPLSSSDNERVNGSGKESIVRILIYVISYICGTAGLIIAFWYVIRSGKVIRGAFIGWGLSIVCVFLVSVVFPWPMSFYHSEYCKYFPEATGVPLVILTGLIPALIVATFAGFVRELMKWWRKSVKTEKSRDRDGESLLSDDNQSE